MWWSLVLLGSVMAAHPAHHIHVYHPTHFQKNDHCVSAACSTSQICVVTAGRAICVDREGAVEHLGKHQYSEHGADSELFRRHSHKHHDSVDHKKHDNLGEYVCTSADFDSMGGRLLQWFSQMHNINGGVDVSLKKHKVACRPDVAWMFEQWDGNNDGLLTKAELAPLEGGMREKCLAQFIDMCDDMKVDGEISVDEWCDCFTFSDDSRHEPPCHKAKHHVDPHLLGVFLPRCDLEGFYHPEQCHDGHCWCVDKYGREFDNSRVNGQLPDCGQYATDLDSDESDELKARL